MPSPERLLPVDNTPTRCNQLPCCSDTVRESDSFYTDRVRWEGDAELAVAFGGMDCGVAWQALSENELLVAVDVSPQ